MGSRLNCLEPDATSSCDSVPLIFNNPSKELIFLETSSSPSLVVSVTSLVSHFVLNAEIGPHRMSLMNQGSEILEYRFADSQLETFRSLATADPGQVSASQLSFFVSSLFPNLSTNASSDKGIRSFFPTIFTVGYPNPRTIVGLRSGGIAKSLRIFSSLKPV